MSEEKSELDQLWAADDANKPSQYRNVGFIKNIMGIQNKIWLIYQVNKTMQWCFIVA